MSNCKKCRIYVEELGSDCTRDGLCSDCHIATQAAEIERLRGIIAKHDLCHDLHGKVGREHFEEGCRRETIKEFGLCGWATRIDTLESELTALRVEVANHFCDVRKIREWLPLNKPAVMSFTSGPEREVADYIEQLRFEAKVAKEP